VFARPILLSFVYVVFVFVYARRIYTWASGKAATGELSARVIFAPGEASTFHGFRASATGLGSSSIMSFMSRYSYHTCNTLQSAELRLMHPSQCA
jgi:hypothetical protein